MFVNLKSALLRLGLFTGALLVLGVTAGATANDASVSNWEAQNVNIQDGNIPVTVTLTSITETQGPIYVSIQTREQYQSIKGFGGILQEASLGEMSATYNIVEPGEYAVSVWHDLDNDGRFSMTKDYQITDGWGASGDAPENRAPTFEDVKIKVETFGATVPVEMKYPN